MTRPGRRADRPIRTIRAGGADHRSPLGR